MDLILSLLTNCSIASWLVYVLLKFCSDEGSLGPRKNMINVSIAQQMPLW
jgi:hypothetical protein